MTSKTLLTIFC